MTRTLIDIDDDLLDEARSILRTDTKVATVRAALSLVVRQHRRDQLAAKIRRGDRVHSAAIGIELDELRREMWRGGHR